MLSASIGETSKMVNLSFCPSSSLSLPVPFVKTPFVVVGSLRSREGEVGVSPWGISGLSARECGREVERDCEKGVGGMRWIKLLFCSTGIGMVFVTTRRSIGNEASLAKSIARPVHNMISKKDTAIGTEAGERTVSDKDPNLARPVLD